MKGDIPSFHIRYGKLISIHGLQRTIIFLPLTFFLLVLVLVVLLSQILRLHMDDPANVHVNLFLQERQAKRHDPVVRG